MEAKKTVVKLLGVKVQTRHSNSLVDLLLLLNHNLPLDESRFFDSARHVNTAEFTLAWSSNVLIVDGDRSTCPHEPSVARGTAFHAFDLAERIG